MKITIKLISALLAVMLLAGALTSLLAIDVSASSTSKSDKDDKSPEDILEEKVLAYTSKEYASPRAKVDTMECMLKKDGYELYVDRLSGEVATVDTRSGQILFSNPWDIKNSKGSESTKAELLSQIHIKYTAGDNSTKDLYSFTDAATSGQITVKHIKNGIRVEYIIGREEAKRLVPRQISMKRFDTVLKPYIIEGTGGNEASWACQRILSFWLPRDPDNEDSETIANDIREKFPITKKFPIYVLDSQTSNSHIAELEEFIKTYCPHYTYEELEADHAETLYEGTDTNPPLFKLAIEYTLDEYGLKWTVPVNGLRFDESMYKLKYIRILPYMGCGAVYGETANDLQEGYTFFPDGSGALFDFQQLNNDSGTTKNSMIYGQDYAYHSIKGKLLEAVRYPVFGIVEQQKLSKEVVESTLKVPEHIDETTGELIPDQYEDTKKIVKYTENTGFVGIIEEGDALATLSVVHSGKTSKYNSIQTLFYPRPQDEYNVADAISGGENKLWTVVSKRKYVGNYTVRYIMLTDENIAKEKNLEGTYPCSWLGMARAYSDYLRDQGKLTRLTDADIIEESIPLYIETFGTFETLEKILSIPVNVMTPLTTFDDIETMYKELSENGGIKNINFKLSYYSNGGYYNTVPYKLKWEKAVGGKDGFKKLIEYAKSVNDKNDGSNLGIYPDFDFSYIYSTGFADGLSMKKHAVKTIDDRYTGKRKYSATLQSYIGYYGLAISPAYMSHFYDEFTERYLKYDPIGISVGTLGSDLNSDFDEDEPYNREDSKKFVTQIFEKLKKQYKEDKNAKIMTDKGNAYTWSYVDHIINLPLDSSRYISSSNSVPFIGVVLHGYIQFAGTPYNMEGNTNYAFLKAIENGASLYFTLTYQNAQKFKEYWDLSQYYSISYEIWYDELCETYNELNSVLKDVQTKLIINHEFLVGERVPEPYELENDILEIVKEAIKSEDEAVVNAALKAQQNILKARAEMVKGISDTAKNIETLNAEYNNIVANYNKVVAALADIDVKEAAVVEAIKPVAALLEAYNKAIEEYDASYKMFTDANAIKSQYLTALSNAMKEANIKNALATDAYKNAKSEETAKKNEYTKAKNDYSSAISKNDESTIAEKRTAFESAKGAYSVALEATKKSVKDYCDTLGDAGTASFSAYETAFNAYYDQELATDLLQLASVEKQFARNTAQATHKAATDAVTAAQGAVKSAVSALSTAVTTLTNSYSRNAIVKSLENGALKNAESAKNALELINSNTDITKAVRDEISENATEVLKNVTLAVSEGIRIIPKIAEGNRVSMASDVHRLELLDTSLKDAFEKLKAESSDKEIKDNFDAELKEAQSVADSVIGKLTNLTKIYNSVKTYKAFIDNSDKATAEDKSNAELTLKTVEEEFKTVKEITDRAVSKLMEFNSMIKGYGYINIKKVEVDVEETPDASLPSEGDGEIGNTPEEGGEQTLDEGDSGNSQDDVELENTKYTSSDGQIVAVTYGGKNGKDESAYKTFVLNYNYFAVTVKYNGVLYTIPANGYIVIYR